MVLFLNRPSKKITLYFDNMRLLRRPDFVEAPRNDGMGPSLRASPKGTSEAISIKEVFEPVSIKSTLPSKGLLEVYVANLSNPKKIEVLVSNGIPFAPGQLFSEKNFAVFNNSGKEISIAVTVLARWTYDNSIRSLLVQFPLEIEHKYEQVFIQWGVPRKTRDIKLTEVVWVIPEGFIVLPAHWLCASQIIGEQVPVGKHTFENYDQNIEKYYPKIKNTTLTGDITKDGFYNTPHVFYQLYVRSEEEMVFKSARKEAVNYRKQIIQEGPNRGRHISRKSTHYIYVQAMIDDYLLTGDEKSLTVAGYMAEYLKNNFEPSRAFFSRNSTHFWTERKVAFPFLGAITYFELTGEQEYLQYCSEIMKNLYKTQLQWPERGGFIHNLYSHDPEEGARKDEYGGSPFMTGLLLEAVIKYHKLTNSNIAKDSLFRALDWLIAEGLSPDGKSLVYLTCDKHKDGAYPNLNLLLVHAFGYGYKISGGERKDYLKVGRELFECGIQKAYLGNPKHFNQNYRSSGHFLAYIANEKAND